MSFLDEESPLCQKPGWAAVCSNSDIWLSFLGSSKKPPQLVDLELGLLNVRGKFLERFHLMSFSFL
ncbi:MAG: hypothetical protein A2901_06945 [Elusimicrobia bacterium RIFCSPLOWO2_01_FULL_54_10]|nr:MAG: hypothetical protein A2901_06945 [Elusimicrobia bacterium RIFCSPLOWO2_01_FULL_54_10]